MNLFNKMLSLLLCVSFIGNLFLFTRNKNEQKSVKKLPLQPEYVTINPTLINKTNKGYEITYTISYTDQYKDLFDLDAINMDSFQIPYFLYDSTLLI